MVLASFLVLFWPLGISLLWRRSCILIVVPVRVSAGPRMKTFLRTVAHHSVPLASERRQALGWNW